MKLLLAMIILTASLLIVSCTQITIPRDHDELLVRYIAIAYNKGHNLTFEQLSNLVDKTSYDDSVWNNYRYFRGQINLQTFVTLREPTVYDPRLLNYFKSLLTTNSSASGFVDNFDEPLPSNDLNPPRVKNEALTERVYELIKYDYSVLGLFRTWYEKYFNDELSDKEIFEYAQTLVELAEGYTFEIQSQLDGSEFFISKVNLASVPTELVLAIMYHESRLFPASFRAEISDGRIVCISLGLGHILVDVDNFGELVEQHEDIGNGKVDLYTFELLRSHYFPEVSGTDLLQIRGSILLTRTYLGLLKHMIELGFSSKSLTTTRFK